MVFNEEKRNKLAELIVCRQVALTGAGGSAPTSPLPIVAPSQDSLGPALGDKRKGVVRAIESEDENTDTGLVFKRPRVGVTTTSLSATDGHAHSFRDNPPSASSPRGLLTLEGGGESAPGRDQVPPAPELPAILQHALRCFKEKEAVAALGGDLMKDHMGQSLGEFLVNSLTFVSQAEARMKGEVALQAQTFANRETTLNQELNNLRQLEKETKKLLFDKGQEAL